MSLQSEAPVSFSQHQLLAEQGSFMEELYSGTWNLDHSSEMQGGNTGAITTLKPTRDFKVADEGSRGRFRPGKIIIKKKKMQRL